LECYLAEAALRGHFTRDKTYTVMTDWMGIKPILPVVWWGQRPIIVKVLLLEVCFMWERSGWLKKNPPRLPEQ